MFAIVLSAGLLLQGQVFDRLHGGEFAAAVLDMDSGEILLSVGEGEFPVGDGIPFPGDRHEISLEEAVDFLVSAYSSSGDCPMPEPDMGERLSEISERGGLRGWTDTGDDYRNFVLVDESGGRGFVLLCKNLCCPGKGDLAFRLLWRTAPDI